jgi:hypothetical protein
MVHTHVNVCQCAVDYLPSRSGLSSKRGSAWASHRSYSSGVRAPSTVSMEYTYGEMIVAITSAAWAADSPGRKAFGPACDWLCDALFRAADHSHHEWNR